MVPKQTEADRDAGAALANSMDDVRCYAFSGRDSGSQMGMFVLSLHLVQIVPLPFNRSWQVFFYTTVACLVIMAGLRFSISVKPGRVLVIKKWIFIPYWFWSAAEIEAVWYSDDWGREGEDMGVTVQLGDKEVIIGSVKTMHQLHSALRPWTRVFRERNVEPITGPPPHPPSPRGPGEGEQESEPEGLERVRG